MSVAQINEQVTGSGSDFVSGWLIKKWRMKKKNKRKEKTKGHRKKEEMTEDSFFIAG